MGMTKYKLTIMPRAENDIINIFEYLSQELSVPAAAHGQMRDIENAFLRLQDFPESSPVCQDSILRRKGYRKLLVNNYIALYTVDNAERTVTIMRVVHGRQNYARFV